jgi:hypothetical protein
MNVNVFNVLGVHICGCTYAYIYIDNVYQTLWFGSEVSPMAHVLKAWPPSCDTIGRWWSL